MSKTIIEINTDINIKHNQCIQKCVKVLDKEKCIIYIYI